jgi:hypothetical protein
LSEFLPPFAHLNYCTDFIFQQDNASIHTSARTKVFFGPGSQSARLAFEVSRLPYIFPRNSDHCFSLALKLGPIDGRSAMIPPIEFEWNPRDIKKIAIQARGKRPVKRIAHFLNLFSVLTIMYTT